MSAEIHQLHQPEGRGHGKPSNEGAGAWGRAVAAELRARACSLLGERLQTMFEGADDLLFEMSERALNNDERRVYFDTMRVVRLERPQLAQAFERELARCFEPDYRPNAPRQALDQIDFSHLALQDSETLEQSIAVANMESKAESLYRNHLWELERRLEALVRLAGAPISPRAFAPAGLCQAFRSATDVLSVGFDIRLVIYKLFDRLVIGDLGPVYAEALRLLEHHGVQPLPAGAGSHGPRASAPGAAAAAAGPGPGMPGFETVASLGSGALPSAAGYGGFSGGLGGAGGMPSYAPASLIDAHTLGALQYVGGGGRGPSRLYSDAVLAAELAAAARGQVVHGIDAGHAWASVQRAGLVGRMFNDILADPHMPGPIKPIFDDLRFPAIKSALRDIAFFSNPQHPVRALINELATMAASSRAAEPETQARMRELVEQVRSQFDVAAEQVRPAVEKAQAVAETDIERFLEAQLEQGRRRRQAILDKAKRVVAQELQLHTLGHSLPEGVRPLLNSGWAPMMGVTLLRQGVGSEAWGSGIELLQRIVRSLTRDCEHEAAQAAERNGLIEALRGRITDVGMPAARCAELLEGLRACYDQLDAAALLQRMQAVGAAAAPQQASTEAGVQPALPLEPAAPPATLSEPPRPAPVSPERLLQLLLLPGAWFRVFDREHGDTRWLKVTLFDQVRARVAFAEFDGRNALTLDGADLYEDLLTGRSEPIDPSPPGRHALRELLATRRTAEVL